MTLPGGAAARERTRFGPGLYMHYPFCRSRCGYCDFFVVLGDRPARAEFFDSLLGEIDFAASDPLWADQFFQTIFLGGGTPSLLESDEMAALLNRLRDRFQIAPDAEVTVECNPESLRAESIHAYRDAGVTRFSLGVQSMNSPELALLDRAHGVTEVRSRVTELRSQGLDSFNLDLIYGLPGSDDASWCGTLEAALTLQPSHLSAYLLSLEPHVPLARRLGRGEVSPLPVDEGSARQYEELRRQTARAGLAQYEISNFAQPGQESRHNQNYWVRGDYLGLGPSAHSHRDGWRWSNVRSLSIYRDRIASGMLPRADEGERLDARAEAEEWLFLGLRRTEGISWAVLEESGLPLGSLRDRAEGLARDGWLILGEGWMRLDPRAYFVSNSVFGELAAAL